MEHESRLAKPKGKAGRPPNTDVELSKHVKQFAVILPDKSKVLVPVDELAAREKGKILVARLHGFVETQLNKMEGQTMTAKEVSDMVQAVARLEDLSRAQWLAGEGGGGSAPSAFGQGSMEKLVGAMAKGTAAGLMEKLEKIKQAEKKVEPEPVVDVEAK